MKIRANGRSAFIAISGLLALYGGPALASAGANSGRIVVAQNDAKADVATTSGKATRTRHHQRTSSRHKTEKVAKSSGTKSSVKKNPAADTTSDRADALPPDGQGGMTPAVANANAQMTGSAPADAQAVTQDAAPATPAPAMQDAASDNAAAADAPVVASDQLNDVDRAAGDDKSPPRILRPGGKSSYVANASTEDTWSQTSLIGKIFIGFGGFLTLASAARMFIA